VRILRQSIATVVLAVRGIPLRVGSGLVIVCGMGGVVAVVIAIQAMSTGLFKVMEGTGRDDRVIVLSAGATSELTSSVDRRVVAAVTAARSVKRDGRGQAIASAEVLSLVPVKRRDGSEASVPMRGVDARETELRPEIKITEGRMFTGALNETVVGRMAKSQYRGLGIGDEVQTQGAMWRIVGVFESDGDIHESELLVDAIRLRDSLSGTGTTQSITALLESASMTEDFKSELGSNPTLAVDVLPEPEYYAAQARNPSGVLSVLAYVVGGIMAIGALCGAVNSMHSAIDSRAVEIATLRAIGFCRTSIIISVMFEALLLALIGGVVGSMCAWWSVNGVNLVSTAGGVVGESHVFTLQVTPGLVERAIALVLLIALAGGIFPALWSVRRPVAASMRTL
jgi:putative ABC transport system permease protein